MSLFWGPVSVFLWFALANRRSACGSCMIICISSRDAAVLLVASPRKQSRRGRLGKWSLDFIVIIDSNSFSGSEGSTRTGNPEFKSHET